MMNRLSELLATLLLKLSGLSTERLCQLLHIMVSDTTLTRMLHNQPVQECATPKVLGVDDWALKKRNQYCTILVDLEDHKVIDLLQDRKSSTIQK
jgi:transposase